MVNETGGMVDATVHQTKINLLQGVDGYPIYPWNVFRIEAFDHGMSLPDAIPHAHNPSGSDSSVDHSFEAPPTIYYLACFIFK